MSMHQGSGKVKGSGSSVQTSSVRVTSGSSSGHYGGGAGGSYAGSHRAGGMNIGGGYGFSSGSGVAGGSYGFGSRSSYGGAGFGASSGFGGGLGFSSSSGLGLGSGYGAEFGGGHGFGEDQGIFSMNDKITMQNLNDRLASYLDKVRSLEEANDQLERKIHEWYQSHGPKPAKDYSNFFKTIEELQKKIQNATVDNARVLLEVDNARLAADDFKLKFENEQYLRHAVEADINGLKGVLHDLTLTKGDLESQLISLREELEALKKNHEEEMKGLKGQAQGHISVDIKAAPANDLQKVLGEMRQEYESIASKNKKDIEDWYHVKSEEVRSQMTKDSQEIKTTLTEVTELRRTVQSLEIELQAQISTKSALEGTLAETEGRYCMQLSQIQDMIHNVEVELSNIRCDMENQKQEYQILLDIKTRLEHEINTYRTLLDGQGTQYPSGSSSYSSGSSSDRSGSSYSVRIRTEDSDGRVISTREQYQPGYRK